MRLQPHFPVIFVFTLLIVFSVAFPHNGVDLKAKRTRRALQCGNKAYKINNICCSLCPAGKRVVSACTNDWETGTCEECDSGTYMDHPNHHSKCLSCTQCRPDQEVSTPCTHTHDAVCRCKPGRFCHDDHPCEVCMKCSKCGTDETVSRNCTATSNTECTKISPQPDSYTAVVFTLVPIALLVVVAAIIGFCCYKKKTRTHDSSSSKEKGGVEGERTSLPLVRENEEERRGLFESSNSSASNSQHSLIANPAYTVYPAHPVYCALPVLASAVTPGPRVDKDDDPLPQLTPTNGVESLKKCFEYFEELDLSYHARFFRHLDVPDNVIKSKETLDYTDRIHSLLCVWLENQGKKASLDQLLSALLDLGQRRTAESICDKAVRNGHYVEEQEVAAL